MDAFGHPEIRPWLFGQATTSQLINDVYQLGNNINRLMNAITYSIHPLDYPKITWPLLTRGTKAADSGERVLFNNHLSCFQLPAICW